jgi:Flagellar hook-length control protein FliK
MIGREYVVNLSRMEAASTPQTHGKMQRPEPADAGYFCQLAKGEKAKMATGLEKSQLEEMQQPDENLREEHTIELGNSQMFIQSPVMDFNFALAEPQRKTVSLAQAFDGKPDVSLDVKISCEPARKGSISHLHNIMKTDQKSSFSHLDIQSQKSAITEKNPRQNAIKAELDLPQIAMIKPRQDDAIMPALTPALSFLNSPVLDRQMSRFADLPAITRVQVDHINCNTAGTLTSLELVLEPVQLGRITARLQHEEGRVTLVLSAEHKHVADDLARDGGLLMRVLGDHIPGVERMAVFVQTEGAQSPFNQRQYFGEFGSGHHRQSEQGSQFMGAMAGNDAATNGSEIVKTNTTLYRVLI